MLLIFVTSCFFIHSATFIRFIQGFSGNQVFNKNKARIPLDLSVGWNCLPECFASRANAVSGKLFHFRLAISFLLGYTLTMLVRVIKVKMSPHDEQAAKLLTLMQRFNQACTWISEVAFREKAFKRVHPSGALLP